MDERRPLEALLGVCTAAVLVPGLGLATARYGPSPPPGVLVAGGAALAVTVAALARTVDDLPDRLGSLPAVAAAVLLPMAYLPYLLTATTPESEAALACVVGLFAVLPGLGATAGGALVRSRRLRAEATELSVFTLGGNDDGDGSGGRSDRLIVGALVAVAVVCLGAGAAVGLARDTVAVTTVTTMLGGLSTLLLLVGGDDDGTEVAVTDRGLRVEGSFTAWADLAGYRVTDDAVELVRPEWYRPARSFERPGMDDDAESALLEGLAEFLPRLDEAGRVEMAARR
jgi:hypothetical protein